MISQTRELSHVFISYSLPKRAAKLYTRAFLYVSRYSTEPGIIKGPTRERCADVLKVP